MEVAQRGILRNRYGNLLGLLEIEVPMPTITALTQYYDTPLRCFTFQNFLLMPTVEEYEQIVDLPFHKHILSIMLLCLCCQAL